MTGSSYQHADRMLQQLARAHLIQPAGPLRYGMHDLLRAYGRELATVGTDQTGQRTALTRVLDHYQHTAAAAIGILFPGRTPALPPIPRPTSPAPPLADTASARAWLDAERVNLVAAASYAADHGWPDHAIRLASTLYFHFDLGGHSPEALSVHASACRGARRLGDRAAEAEALRNASVIEVRQGRHQQASEHFDRALALFRATADRTGQARTLGSVANLAWDNGRYQQAAQAHREVLDLFHQAGNGAGQATAHVNLGLADLRQGHYAEAAGHFLQALGLARETGNRICEAYALRGLGEAAVAQDRYPEATDYLNQALALFRETADRKGEADTRMTSGTSTRARAATGAPKSTTIWPCPSAARWGIAMAKPRRSTAWAEPCSPWASPKTPCSATTMRVFWPIRALTPTRRPAPIKALAMHTLP